MYKSEIHTILSSITPIGLDQMDEVKLMNRVDTKYVFSAMKLPDLLSHLSGSYFVLEIDNIRIFPYHTTYLDTSDLLFYTQHVRGKLSRHKVRYRRYELSGLSFLEIKKKTNKNRTIKWRIKNNLNISSPDEKADAFIRKHLPDILPDLSPVLINGFSRITLVRISDKERVTLDYNLSFGSPDGKNIEFPFLAIAELKRETHYCRSPFEVVMKQIGIQPNRFSKYCIGSALIKDMPLRNTLKSNLLLINKIENEYINYTGYRQY